MRRTKITNSTTTTAPKNKYLLRLCVLAFIIILAFCSYFIMYTASRIPKQDLKVASSPLSKHLNTDKAVDWSVAKETSTSNIRQQQEKVVVTTTTAAQQSSDITEDTNIHVVFSTGCNAFQDWQSVVFFYNAFAVNQQGTVTRIASGCSPEQAQIIKDFHQKYITNMSPHFYLHLTPGYNKIVPKLDYKFFNKPFGVQHWMANKLGYNFDNIDAPENNDNPHNDDLIVICDPDEVIMRPFTHDYTNENVLWRQKIPQYTRVQRGQPIAQEFGIGARWLQKMDWSFVFGGDTQSLATQLTEKTVMNHYAVGPPYLAVGHDMFRIVKGWTQVVVPVHNLTVSILSEMYGYSVGAAHANLPHQLARSFMVSHTGVDNGEGWPLLDAEMDKTPIDKLPTNVLPYTLHFCQRYFIGPSFFSKYALPKEKDDARNFMSCQHPLLAEPSADLYKFYNSSTTVKGTVLDIKHERHRYRANFMLYYLIRRVNDGIAYYKHEMCSPGTANLEKTFHIPLLS